MSEFHFPPFRVVPVHCDGGRRNEGPCGCDRYKALSNETESSAERTVARERPAHHSGQEARLPRPITGNASSEEHCRMPDKSPLVSNHKSSFTDPPFEPTPLPFGTPPPQIGPLDLPFKNPFVRPPVPDLSVASQKTRVPIVTALDYSTPCYRWNWKESVLRLLPRYRYRSLHYYNNGCNGPGSLERKLMAEIYGQAVGMAEVATRVVRRYLSNATLPERRGFWMGQGIHFTPYPLNFVSPHPVQWLGEYSEDRQKRLVSVISKVRDLLVFGYNGTDGYSIWCKDRWGRTGSSTNHRIRFSWDYFTGPVSRHEFWMGFAPDEPSDPNPAWRDRISPCYSHRLLFHEILHWSGFQMNDKRVTHKQAWGTDKGPCAAYLSGPSKHKVCYGGLCAQQIADSKGKDYFAEHNPDNYAFLIRNIALYCTCDVMTLPTAVNYVGLEGAQCTLGKCTQASWQVDE